MIHLIASLFALFFGSAVLLIKKGTKTHVRMGYAYTVSMLVLLVTAFMIYRLFNGWGLFHWLAVVSTLSLLAGIIPAFLRKPVDRWQSLHYNFMFWSVFGLYAAFAAEVFTRIPSTPFFGMVGLATGAIMGLAYFIMNRNRDKWERLMGIRNNGKNG